MLYKSDKNSAESLNTYSIKTKKDYESLKTDLLKYHTEIKVNREGKENKRLLR